MFHKSIRWRLAISYAAIVLLAAFSLGLVLILILRGYYLNQEAAYIRSAGEQIASRMAPFFEQELPTEVYAAQVTGYAFLTQVRIQVEDASGRLLADSGAEQASTAATISLQVDVPGASQVISQTLGGAGLHYRSVILVDDGERRSQLVVDEQVSGSGESIFSEFPVSSPFGWLAGSGAARSNRQVKVPIYTLSGSQPAGFVRLLEGPAFGQAIVARVAWGWALASLAATLIGAAAGWRVSRYISQPLLDLTTVTGRMMNGDLAARAAASGDDEPGRLAAAFNSMAGQVEHTVQSLRRFVSDAAHELQTPLTVLHSDLELLHGGAAPGSLQEQRVERARAQVLRLEAITAGLLDLSRIEAVEAAHRPVWLSRLLAQTSELFASRAEQAGLAFTLDLPGEDVSVAGDEGQLRLVVVNLLENAIKFNHPGGSVQVKLRQEAENILITIRDEGIGIPPDELVHIPGRFHRAANAREIPGSGLGLAIVSAVVERHAGRLVIESGQGGVVVTVCLPVESRPRD